VRGPLTSDEKRGKARNGNGGRRHKLAASFLLRTHGDTGGGLAGFSRRALDETGRRERRGVGHRSSHLSQRLQLSASTASTASTASIASHAHTLDAERKEKMGVVSRESRARAKKGSDFFCFSVFVLRSSSAAVLALGLIHTSGRDRAEKARA